MTDTHIESHRIAQALDRLVRRLSTTVSKRLAATMPIRLPPFHGMVMLAISDNQPCRIGVLSAELGRDHSQMTRVLRHLEENGLVRRDADDTDGRSSIISLTQLGQEHNDICRAVMGEAVNELASGFPAQDRRQLAEILEGMACAPTSKNPGP